MLLQVANCTFGEAKEEHLCILQPKTLAVHRLEGGASIIPLPSQFSDIFPLETGLLLAVSPCLRSSHGYRQQLAAGVLEYICPFSSLCNQHAIKMT